MPVGVSTGAMAWWSMFLVYIPVIGGLAWPVVVIMTFLNQRSNPFEPARINARNGLNWMLTYIVVQIALALPQIVVSIIAARYGDDGTVGVFAFFVVMASVIWGVSAIVIAIRGGIAAGRGGAVHARGADPVRPGVLTRGSRTRTGGSSARGSCRGASFRASTPSRRLGHVGRWERLSVNLGARPHPGCPVRSHDRGARGAPRRGTHGKRVRLDR